MDERPLTRADLVEVLSAMQTEFKADLAELKAELRTEFRAALAEQRREILETTQEQVRDAQTEILKAFLPFTQEHDIKFRAFEVRLGNTETELRARMDVLSHRLAEIEEKLRMRPPAA